MTQRRKDSPADLELAELHDAYVWSANAALTAGRDDLARAAVQDYADEALEVLVQSQPTPCG